MLVSSCSSAAMSVRRSKARRAMEPSDDDVSAMERITCSWRAHSRRSVSTSPDVAAGRPSWLAATAQHSSRPLPARV